MLLTTPSPCLSTISLASGSMPGSGSETIRAIMEEDDLAGIVTWSLTGSHATSPDYYIGHICDVQSNFDVAVAGLRHVTQGRWSLGLCPLRPPLQAGRGNLNQGRILAVLVDQQLDRTVLFGPIK